MGKWKECKLADVATNLAMGPFGSNIKAENFVESGVPVIRGKNFNFNKYIDGDFVYICDEKADELEKSNCFPDDLVFTHRGTIGQVGLIPKGKFPRYVISQSGMKLTVDKNFLDENYLFYFFKSDIGQHELLKNESQVGVPAISSPLSSLKSVDLKLPPLSEQKDIASVLSSLDDKIDVLHRQNKTLEAMAETFFRQWFVEEAQEDWEGGKLGEFVTITRGASPRPIIKYIKNGTIPWIKIADATRSSSFYINSTREFIIEEGISKSVRVFPGDLILSNSATCGLPFIVELEGCIHDGWLLFRNFNILSKFFVFFFLKRINKELNNVADGSVQNNLNTSILKELELKIPDGHMLKRFDDSVITIINKIKNNNKQIHTLEKLRDTLLPKLMSGEVKVLNHD
jgi:type I restriction enzyme, S subunit